MIYSKSKATDELTSSGASNYLEFVSVKKIFVHYLDKFLSVPCTKSEIFISDDLELIEKQKLLNFIYSVIKICSKELDVNTTVDIKKDYDLESEILDDIKSNTETNAAEFLHKRFTSKLQTIIKLVLCNSEPNLEDLSLIKIEQLVERIYKFLISLQVYDDTPFLYPQFGSSEFSQALCRLSAVNQTIFIVHDKITIKTGYNNGKFINADEKKFAIQVHDSSNDESFFITSNNLILNENFLDPHDNSFYISDEIIHNEFNIIKGNTINRFTSFYVIEGEDEKRKIKEGPVIFKVEKDDHFYQNAYGLTVYEFFMNSNSVPRNRSMLEVIINIAEGVDEVEFISQCSQISDSFFKHHLNGLNQDDSSKFSLIASFKFYQEIRKNTINVNQSSRDIIITENNYTDIDLDYYYEKADNVVKQNEWTLPKDKEKEESNFNNFNDEVSPDNLIDELFNSL